MSLVGEKIILAVIGDFNTWGENEAEIDLKAEGLVFVTDTVDIFRLNSPKPLEVMG